MAPRSSSNPALFIGLGVGAGVLVIVVIIVALSSGGPPPVRQNRPAPTVLNPPEPEPAKPQAAATADACFARLREYSAIKAWRMVSEQVDPDRKASNVAYVLRIATDRAHLLGSLSTFVGHLKTLGIQLRGDPSGAPAGDGTEGAARELLRGVTDLDAVFAYSLETIERFEDFPEIFAFHKMNNLPVEVTGDTGVLT